MRTLGYVGSISYGLYVYHYVVQCVVADLMGEHPGWNGIVSVGVTTLMVTIALAFASFHFVETPILRLKSNFSR